MRTEKTGQLPLPSFDGGSSVLLSKTKYYRALCRQFISAGSPGQNNKTGVEGFSSASIDRLIQEERFADVLDFWDRAFQIKRLGQDDLENLLHIDAVACAAEDQAGAHGFGESSGLPGCQHCCH